MKPSMHQIHQANRDAGYHFFDRNTMRFFDSRILLYVYHGPGGTYFVTSEQFHPTRGTSEPRRYTVRKFFPESGDIKSASKFATMGKREAQKAASALARGSERND